MKFLLVFIPYLMGALVAFYLFMSTKNIVLEGEEKNKSSNAMFFSLIWPLLIPFLILELSSYLIKYILLKKPK